MNVLSPLLLSLPVLAAAGEASPAARPDFSAVTSVAAAKKLATSGELVQILFFPAELGGHADRENIGYITPQAAAGCALAIGTLKRLFKKGAIDQMTVEPDYRGESIVPTRIRMKAWRQGKKGDIEHVIEIW